VPVIDVWNKRMPQAGVQRCRMRQHHVACRPGPAKVSKPCARSCCRLAGWQSVPEGIYMARERHVQALQRVAHGMWDRRKSHVALPPPLDLVAEELRLAQNALGEITGAFGADDLLGVIFSRFCIGK
jgi:tRNA modification GTPase